jgi:hypothetical protein
LREIHLHGHYLREWRELQTPWPRMPRHVAQRGEGRQDIVLRKLRPPEVLTFGSIAFLKPVADKVNW